MYCFIDECIFRFKEQGFPQVLKTWKGFSKFDGGRGRFTKYIGDFGGLKMTFLKSR